MSQPPYEAVFEAMPQAFALWSLVYDERGEPCDLEGRAANEAFRLVFNLPVLVGERLGKLDPNYRDRGPDILEICSRVAATKTMEAHEVYHPRMDRWLELRVAAVPDDLLLTYAEDITERRRALEALRRLQYSLDQTDDYPAWSDSAGRLIEVSESTCRHLEYTRDELLSMTIFDICPDIDHEAFAATWAPDRPRSPFRLEVHHRAKSGRVYPVEATVNPMVFDGQEYDCTFCRDITERKRLEESLRVTQLSVEHAPDMIHWVDHEGRITYANRSMCELLGQPLEELQTKRIWEISAALTPEVFKARWDKAGEGEVTVYEETWLTNSGEEIAVEVSATNVVQGGTELGLAFVRDITSRKRAEQVLRESEEKLRHLLQAQSATLKALKDRDEQLQQAQKMEAVGRLAGGIAHDFNNVLTTIIGYSELLLASPDCPPGSVAEDIGEIKSAAERAAALTHSILAFSRRQALQPKVMSLNTIVSDTKRLLTRTIGSDVELRTLLDPGLGQVKIDEHQFVQVLLNLAVNSRDAMPSGGTVTIATKNVELDGRFCKTHPEVRPGPYVTLTVDDTGTGMDQEVLAHVFEPFYTTKPPGQGTGLGLATVYGIVAQSGGCVYVKSRLGKGTTFTIYLPRIGGPAEAPPAEQAPPASREDRPTILVVDADAAFRILATRILERRGYDVLSMSDGQQALAALADSKVRIDALITDVALPGSTGAEQLGALASTERPGIPVLYMADQARDALVSAGRLDQQAVFLEKPFTAEELTRQVRTCLFGNETGPSA